MLLWAALMVGVKEELILLALRPEVEYANYAHFHLNSCTRVEAGGIHKGQCNNWASK